MTMHRPGLKPRAYDLFEEAQEMVKNRNLDAAEKKLLKALKVPARHPLQPSHLHAARQIELIAVGSQVSPGFPEAYHQVCA